jgi:hypothetical protein
MLREVQVEAVRKPVVVFINTLCMLLTVLLKQVVQSLILPACSHAVFSKYTGLLAMSARCTDEKFVKFTSGQVLTRVLGSLPLAFALSGKVFTSYNGR